MFLRRSLKLATGIASAAFAATRTFALCDEKDVFKSRGDPYDGVSVSSASVAACESQAAFEARLDRSLDEWKRGGRRGDAEYSPHRCCASSAGSGGVSLG